MNSGPGVGGRTRTTRTGGGGPILTPIETCANTGRANKRAPTNNPVLRKRFPCAKFMLAPTSLFFGQLPEVLEEIRTSSRARLQLRFDCDGPPWDAPPPARAALP